MNEKIILTAETLLNMSIADFQHYSQYVGEAKLWELFYEAQKSRDRFANSMKIQYIETPIKKEWLLEDGSRPKQIR